MTGVRDGEQQHDLLVERVHDPRADDEDQRYVQIAAIDVDLRRGFADGPRAGAAAAAGTAAPYSLPLSLPSGIVVVSRPRTCGARILSERG